MKLYYSPTSPFVRKVTVLAIETGLDRHIERIPTDVWSPSTGITADNPLGKVPTLITDGGEALYDSPVICEYLDTLHDGLTLFPSAGGPRWTALRRQALADGVLDAGVARRLEELRPEGERSASWAARQTAVVGRGLDALEEEARALDGAITIGHVAIGCALGWLDFRFPGDRWRDGRAALAQWFEGFAGRRSMRETVPA
ncbi:MAG: glutathione S-transferase N-terminal domain-containing protein [Rhodospirillales bacterium]